ncbi:hypothetical protein [Streptomyces sp. NPDC004008]
MADAYAARHLERLGLPSSADARAFVTAFRVTRWFRTDVRVETSGSALRARRIRMYSHSWERYTPAS